eukprot:13385593-Alexandrium_andersonii.AAC.1
MNSMCGGVLALVGGGLDLRRRLSPSISTHCSPHVGVVGGEGLDAGGPAWCGGLVSCEEACWRVRCRTGRPSPSNDCR